MKRNLLLAVLLGGLTLLSFYGCENEYPPSVWDPDDPGAPTPVITQIVPPDVSYEGVGIIEIYGHNFSANPQENLVFFNGKKGIVLTADTNYLKVKCPVVIESPTQSAIDSVSIKIAVPGAYLFAEYKNPDGTLRPYRLEKAAFEWGGFTTDKVHAIACDKEENLYVALEDNTICKIDSNNTKIVWGMASSSLVTGMKIGPGGDLYYCRNYKNIYRIAADGSTPVANQRFNATALPDNGKGWDLDFDPTKSYIYIAGRATNKSGLYIMKVSDASSVSVADYNMFDLKSVRVYNGYVYVAGQYYGTDTSIADIGIWRSQIVGDGGTLGPRELVLDWIAYKGSDAPEILAITMDEDGKIYIGCKEKYTASKAYDGGDALTVFDPVTQTMEVIFPEVLQAPSAHFAWGVKNYLYLTRTIYDSPTGATGQPTSRVIRVTLRKKSAPYYGRE